MASTVKPINKNVDPYPMDAASQWSQGGALPGELAPMEEGGGSPYEEQPPAPQPDEFPSVQGLMDDTAPPFIPSTYSPPPIKQSRSPTLTEPYGLQMAMFLNARNKYGPRPRPGSAAAQEGQKAQSAGQMAANLDSNAQWSMPVVTQNNPALKQALLTVGVVSPNNPWGMDVSIDVARHIILGPNNDDEITESEFRNKMEQGDDNVAKKNVRKFVNYDGSVTYEILNEDKSVQSRFTLGEYKGKKVFVQGGYSDYVRQLRDILAKMSKSIGSDFERLRRQSTGR